MVCPYCSGDSRVVNSRSHNNSLGVWRRRKCLRCHSVWTTKEQIDLFNTHRVIHTAQNIVEPFSKEKLFVSIKDSLSHRKEAVEEAGALTDTVLSKLLLTKQAGFTTDLVLSMVTETLEKFDRTAAAVYKAKHQL